MTVPNICAKCGSSNPPGARFCQNCGITLGATMTQGRTVILSPAAAPASIQPAAVPPPALGALQPQGVAPALITPLRVYQPTSTQRELTLFVNDVSGSMNSQYDSRYSKLDAAKRAAATMVLEKARLDPNDEIGIVSFDHRAREVLPLCPIASDKQRILNAIQSLAIQGGTDINEGLKTARDRFDWSRQGVVRRIVLLTDGQGGHPLCTAEDLKSRGVAIDVIGVGDNPCKVNEKLLKQVASMVEGECRYSFIKNLPELMDIYTQLAAKTRVGV